MKAIFSLITKVVAYGDVSLSSNPKLRYVDWSRETLGVAVQNPKAEALILQPGDEKIIFDGTRTTTVNGSTQFNVSMVDASTGRYRIAWSGGNHPGFRTPRAMTVTANQLTLTPLANNSLVVQAASGSPFSNVQSGDHVHLDASEFNQVNAGFWAVLASAGNAITLVRFTGEEFAGVSETVTLTNTKSLIAYTPAGVQPGDKVAITAGFAVPLRRTFRVESVTSEWIEIFSSTALPSQTNVQPDSIGMRFYTSSKRFLRIEADQECVVRVNADDTDSNVVSPWSAGDSQQMGEYCRTGPTWALKVINKSALPLNLIVISAE